MVGSYTNSRIPILIKVIQLSQNSQTITVLLVGGHKTAAEKLVFMPACSLFFDIPILPLAHVVGLKIAFFLDRWPKPSLITISDHLLCHDEDEDFFLSSSLEKEVPVCPKSHSRTY